MKLEESAPPPPRKRRVPLSGTTYRPTEPNGDLRIIRPLAPEVQKLLHLSNQRRSPRKSPAQHLIDAIKQGKVVWHLFGTSVVQLSPKIAVKFGSNLPIDEAVTMAHILTHAPDLANCMPASLGVTSISSYNYHFMTFIPGVSLDKIWSTLAVPQKKSIQSQLAPILHRLRQIPLPSDPAIGSGDPPRCKDFRRWTRVCPEKIYTEDEFNAFVLSNPHTNPAMRWNVSPLYVSMLRSRMRTDHAFCVTHGDVRPANIIVEQTKTSDVHVKGLVDWGNSGVYPEYMEYIRSLYLFQPRGLRRDGDDWFEYLPTESGMGCYVDEYLLHDHIDTILGGKG